MGAPLFLRVCAFDCSKLLGQNFSSQMAVTIVSDGAVNLDLCLALMGSSSEGAFTCHTCCNLGPWFIWSHPKKFCERIVLHGQHSKVLKYCELYSTSSICMINVETPSTA